MVDSLKLPEKSRIALRELYLAARRAQQSLQQPLLVALDFLGLDPTLDHGINFDTGVVTPAQPITKPELVKDEEVAS